MYGYPMAGNMIMRRVAWVLAAMLLSMAPAYAQLEIGDKLKMHLNGSAGLGYGGAFGSNGNSGHSISFNGTGTVTGSYFHPSFLSFSVQPYYNRSQSNSASKSIFDETGVTSTANFFGGSHFPGAVSFTKTSNSSGEFGIPGEASLTTEGASRAFAISWNAFVPKLPTLSANFSTGSSSTSVLGVGGDNESSNRNFSLDSTYTLRGWRLNGNYSHQSVDFTIPGFLSAAPSSSVSSGSSLGFSANHRLPMAGTFGAGWSRSTWGSENGHSLGGSAQSASAGVSLTPIRKLTFYSDVRYTGNLLGVIRREVFQEGATVPPPIDNTSRSLVFNNSAYVGIGHGLGLNGHINHREQFFRGEHVSDTQYGGVVTYRYQRPLLGLLYFSFGMVDSATERGNSGLSFNANVGLTRRFGRWETAADFSYAQNVQTLLLLYTTSSYTYGGSVRRRVNSDTFWHFAARRSQSGLAQKEGNNSHSETFTTGLGWRRYGVSASYSQSGGASVLGPSGILTPNPLAGLITNDLLLFNGSSYGFTLSAVPLRKLVVTASYSSFNSDTLARSIFSLNRGERYNARLDYKLRKMVLRAGFTRTWQGISAFGAAPSVINSYYFGVSRWFEFF